MRSSVMLRTLGDVGALRRDDGITVGIPTCSIIWGFFLSNRSTAQLDFLKLFIVTFFADL